MKEQLLDYIQGSVAPLSTTHQEQPQAAQIYYNDFHADKRKSKFNITQDDWDIIRRNNTPDKTLAEKSKKLLGKVYKLIEQNKDGKAWFSYETLSKMLNCKKWQIVQIRKEIAHIVKSKWKKGTKINGSIKRKVIVFEYTKYGRDILARPHVYYGNGNSEEIVNACGFPHISIKDEKNVIKKDLTRALGSNILNNSFSDNQTQTTENNEAVKIEPKSKILANAATSESQETQQINQESAKAKVIKTRHERFGGYREPQTLEQMHKRLTPEICSELRSISGRDFSNNFIEQRVLAMSKKPELATRRFKYQKGFIFYMALALQHELHDSVKTGNVDFRLLANITVQDRFHQRQEKFLAEIENTRQISPEWHFKKKLVSVLSAAKAYELLQAYTSSVMAESTLEICLSRHVELTQLEQDLVLDQARATHERMDAETMEMEVVGAVEFVVGSTASPLVGYPVEGILKAPQIELPEGVWGEISQKLIDELGVDSYRNWFSKVTADVDEVAKTIALKAPSEFVKDWIEHNYLQHLTRVSEGIFDMAISFSA